MFLFGLLVVFKLLTIQLVDGEKYKALAEERTIQERVIPANRGNVYSSDGSLLATSIPKYNIHFDAVTPSNKNFKKYLEGLSDSLSNYSGKSSAYYKKSLQLARENKNRYIPLANNIGYSDYLRFRAFPLLELGAFKGGLIVEQKVKREHPMGDVAQRTIGYERTDDEGNVTRAGIDGAFGVDYLRGKDGKRLKQKIGKGQWKPILDYDQVEPKDGFDVYTTIDVNIQDIAHHALLEQLELYEAEHGTVVVMEVSTGEVKAIANLGKTKAGYYYEKRNYAVYESHEPGSTFKLMALMAAIEDNKIDTSDVINTGNGYKVFYGRGIKDSHGNGKISAARALELSSNIGLATIIDNAYAKDPERFLDILSDWNLDKKLGISIRGEGSPMIPRPGDSKWSRNALPSIAYGYNLKLTPLQTLTFYNAVANKGVMVKPRFIKEVKEFDKPIETFEKTIINEKICSDATLNSAKEMLKNVVVRGTAKSLYSDYFSMSGKTGTARVEYWMKDWAKNPRYISSFAGYFPSDKPKYSCIVVIHKPSIKKGFYGADVSGPVFKKVAQKIFTDTPLVDRVATTDVNDPSVEKEYENYYALARTYKTIMPDVRGMSVMDALALLENMRVDLKVQCKGVGTIKSQSISKNTKLKNNQIVVLQAS